MFLRRFSVKAQDGLTAAEALDRLAVIERALTLQLHDKHQAAVNSQEGATVANLIQALNQTPSACLVFGSLVIVKFEKDGKPEVHARQLSAAEIKALERYPDLHKKPETFFESLADLIKLPSLDDTANDSE